VPEPVAAPLTALDVMSTVQSRLFGCMQGRPDALWEVCVAIAGAPPRISSIAQLMLQPGILRGWGSLYQGLEHGRIDTSGVRTAAVRMLTPKVALLFAIDSSKFPRPDGRVCADLGMQYDPTRVGLAVPGWAMLACAQVGLGGLSAPRASWVVPVDAARVATDANTNEQAAAMIERVADATAAAGDTREPIFLLDSGFCPIFLTQKRPGRVQLVVRLRSDRVFYRRAEPIPGATGRPPIHGARFDLADPGTWGLPDAEHCQDDPDGPTVITQAWHRLHPQAKQRRKWTGTGVVEGTVIRREQRHQSGWVQVWWLWWSGPDDAFDLATLADAYLHRFTIEHWFRFLKQDMYWTRHATIDPDQAERWTWVLICAYLLLIAARPAVADHRLPWQRAQPVERLTPRRVRAGFPALLDRLPRLAKPPKTSRPGTGRPKGVKNKTQRRPQPVIKKDRPDNTGHRKGRSPRAQQNTKASSA
jgi:hypothetical protein